MTEALIETDEPAPAEGGGGSPGDPGGPPDGAAPEGLFGRLRGKAAELARRFWAMPADAWVTLAVVAGCLLFVILQLRPDELVSSTTPTGGDMSAHVWGPAFLRDHLLPKGRLTGWSPDWYAGFPAFTFYMVPPFLAIALLSLVIPYGVAFKLVAVSGCVTLPLVAWAFGRLNKLPFPVPALLTLGATIFLFDRSYAIYGGNIASTLAGEFSFAISLSLAILYLGVLGYGLRTGKARGWAALLLALCALCHVIPAIFAFSATIVWLLVRPSVRSILYLVTMGPVAALLVGWWYLPFVGRSAYLNDMGWTKLTDWQLLYQRTITDSTNKDYPSLRWFVIGAAVAFVVSVLMRQRAGIYLGLVAAMTALMFRYMPESRFWNARVLPFYYLSIYMMAMLGVGLIIVALTRWFAAEDRPLEIVMQSVVVGVIGLVVYVFLALPMQFLPFGDMSPDGTTYVAEYGLPIGPKLRFETSDISYLGSWADWNFNGLEAWGDKPTKDSAGNEKDVATYDRAYPEFHDLIATLQNVAGEHGCGRAMWEYEEDHNRYGSTMEPMMLPFFTDGCIGSMEGLYFEASSTTPYHFINSTQLSRQGSAPQKDLPYATMPPNQADFDQGVDHLQMLGVKYYLAIDDLMKERAAANTDLKHLTDTGPWSIYLVAGSELVVPMANEPAVLTGPKGVHEWLATSACWYVNPSTWSVPLTADGPDSWQRVDRTVHPPESESAQEKCSSPDGSDWGWLTNQPPAARPLPTDVAVTNIKAGDDSMSFDVSRTGVPVMVRTSYFPNWEVTGGEGPYRVTPNLMVVIPSSNHVELHYGVTTLETGSNMLTFLGMGLLVLLFLVPPLKRRTDLWSWAGAAVAPKLPRVEWARGTGGAPADQIPADQIPAEAAPVEEVPADQAPPDGPEPDGIQAYQAPPEPDPGSGEPGLEAPTVDGDDPGGPTPPEPLPPPPAADPPLS